MHPTRDYVLTAKGNQPGLCAGIQDWLAPWNAGAQDREVFTQSNQGHGRSEARTLVAASLVSGEAIWPGAQQVFCVTRQVWTRKTGKLTTEVVWGVTSLRREQAGPERLLRLNRGHWGIEVRHEVAGGIVMH